MVQNPQKGKIKLTLGHFNWIKFVLDSEIPPLAKYICLYLATYMNAHQDVAWPSLSTISGQTGLSRPTIVKYLEYLNVKKWLIKTVGNTKVHKSNTYAISFPENVETLVKEINYPGKPPLLGLVNDVNPNNNNNKQKNRYIAISGEKASDPKKRKYTRTPSPAGFDELWKLYDRKGNRLPAIKAYKQKGLDQDRQEQNHIGRYITEMRELGHFEGVNRKFVKDFERFILAEVWDNGSPIEDRKARVAPAANLDNLDAGML